MIQRFMSSCTAMRSTACPIKAVNCGCLLHVLAPSSIMNSTCKKQNAQHVGSGAGAFPAVSNLRFLTPLSALAVFVSRVGVFGENGGSGTSSSTGLTGEKGGSGTSSSAVASEAADAKGAVAATVVALFCLTSASCSLTSVT